MRASAPDRCRRPRHDAPSADRAARPVSPGEPAIPRFATGSAGGRGSAGPDVSRSLPMAGPLPEYTLRRSPRSRHLRVTIDPVAGLIVTVPPATRRGWAYPEPTIEQFLRERE